MANKTSRPPFPFIKAVAEAFGFLQANPAAFAAASAGWALIGSVALVGWMHAVIWIARSDGAIAGELAEWRPQLRELLLSLPPLLVELLGMSAVAVSWHRLFILGENPRGVIPFRPYEVLRYVGLTLLLSGAIALLVMLVAFVLMGLTSTLWMSTGASMAISMVPLAVMLLGFFVMLRSGLAMPAAAIGDRAWTLERSWHETNGHGLRLCAGMFIVALPFYIGNTSLSLLTAAVDGLENPFVLLLAALAANAFALLGAAATAGYYSSAFMFFAGRTDKDRPPVSHFS